MCRNFKRCPKAICPKAILAILAKQIQKLNQGPVAQHG